MKKILKKIAEIDAELLRVMEDATHDSELFERAREASRKIYFLYVDVHRIGEVKKREDDWKSYWADLSKRIKAFIEK